MNTEARTASGTAADRQRPRISSFGAAFLLAMGALLIFFGLGGIAKAVEDARIRSSWIHAEARVTHLHRVESGGRSGPRFVVELDVARPDGATIRSARPVSVQVSRGSWSDPPPTLPPGSLVPVYFYPPDPRHMLAASSLLPLYAVPLFMLLLATGGMCLLVVSWSDLAKRGARQRQKAEA